MVFDEACGDAGPGIAGVGDAVETEHGRPLAGLAPRQAAAARVDRQW